MLKDYTAAIDDCIALLTVVDTPPSEALLYEEWLQDLTALFDECCALGELTRGQKEKREEVMEAAIGILVAAAVAVAAVAAAKETPYDKIMKQPQVVQRTPNWYTMRQAAISATQVSTLFASPRQYGTMVLEKAGKMERRSSSREACYTQEMTPFDWGIRFEPVLRRCMETLWSKKVEEVGCFIHANPELRLVASPDGLMKPGSLVEFKCPITREIGKKIPDDYWQQMQIQMEVTGAEECQYVEALFSSSMPARYGLYEGPGLLSGTIHLCQREDGSLTYDYSADESSECGVKAHRAFKTEHSGVSQCIGSEHYESMDIDSVNTIVEIIPWRLIGFHNVTVKRDQVWFSEVIPRIKKFWEDVEIAKGDGFVLPESTRKRKHTCEIIID